MKDILLAEMIGVCLGGCLGLILGLLGVITSWPEFRAVLIWSAAITALVIVLALLAGWVIKHIAQ